MKPGEPLPHGGRLNEAVRTWGIPREQWLDLSTGINPHGWPVPSVPAEVWQRLPEADDGLEQRVRQWLGAPDRADCLPIPGSQWAIQTLPQLRQRGRVGVPQPGYQEHGFWWAEAGHELVAITPDQVAADDHWLDELDVLVWINPNNPTGQIVSAERLLQWHRRLVAQGGWLVVDEAFADGMDGISVAGFTDRPGLVVLKSLGKFFGLAGVRAGAVVTEGALAERLRQRLGPWGLSGPARWVMMQVLQDKVWQQQTTVALRAASNRLAQLLEDHGLDVSGGTLLFQYSRTANAGAIYETLARQGILVRLFDNPPALRFGLPGDDSEWWRLETALQVIGR